VGSKKTKGFVHLHRSSFCIHSHSRSQSNPMS